MLTLEDLKQYGADVETGLARCINNEAFYLKMVKMALADLSGKNQLEKAMAEGDVKSAFEAAHSLKGVYGNLSLTPLFVPVSELTEILRAGSMAGVEPLLEAYLDAFQKLQELAAE